MKKQEKLFLQGRYHQLLEAHARARGSRAASREWVIGAMVFLGRQEEALVLARQQRPRTREEGIAVRFFLALGHIRRSSYREARRELVANLLQLRRRPSPREVFFIYQGAAFYRYFTGHASKALAGARRALDAALAANFAFGKILAYDLSGHVLTQTENVERGLLHLREAAGLARRFENAALAQASEVSILSYQAQYGLAPKTIVAQLKKQLRVLAPTDSYSQATLLLELARQHTLRSELGEATKVLDQAARVIYTHANRRQETILNLRLAQLNYLRGEDYRALSFVQNARRTLDPQVDLPLEVMALGLEHKVVARLDLPQREEQLLRELREKTRRTPTLIGERMLARLTRAPLPDSRGDQLGVLLDAPKKTEELLAHGYHALLPSMLEIPGHDQALHLDLVPGKILAVDAGEVQISPAPTPLLRRFLEVLQQGAASKEELITQVWGHAYHPLRHDPLLYATALSLRRMLGKKSFWLETTEDGYRLKGGVRLTRARLTKVKDFQTKSDGPPLTQGLNHRQLKLLSQLNAEDFVHVKSYMKLHKTSEITACRDLASLCRQGYLIKVGRARATRYTLPR